MTAVIGANARPVARADLPWTDWKNKLKTKNVTTHPLLGILTIGGMRVRLDRVTVGLVHRIL